MAGWMFDEVAMGEEFLVCGTGVFGGRVSRFFGGIVVVCWKIIFQSLMLDFESVCKKTTYPLTPQNP